MLWSFPDVDVAESFVEGDSADDVATESWRVDEAGEKNMGRA